MRKPIIWIIPVIILVCLNWFFEATAQDLSSLTEAERVALQARYGRPKQMQAEIETYQTPAMYESPAIVAVPEAKAVPGGWGRNTIIPFDSLVPFGIELFAGPHEVSSPADIASAADYILGPGDNLIISLWGQAEQEYLLAIDREGKVFIPRLGELICWGKTLGEFKEYVRKRFSSIYSEFNLSVSLGKIRSIRIYMTGEVRRPGAYTVSSLSSLFNALYLAGGPTENGSMRCIRLMRGGRAVGEVDLYKFLLEGDNSSDVRLESGDVIFIPVAGSRVGIRGKVRREAIYELKNDQTVCDLLTLAGEATADAYLDRVALERISDRDEWEFQDLNLNPDRSDSVDNVILEDGDRITIYSIFQMTRNKVAAYGLVKHPGHYERSDSARVSDLIAWAKLQPYDVYYQRANLFRRHPDWRLEVVAINLAEIMKGSAVEDVFLQDGDSLHVYAIGDVSWGKHVYIEGNVRSPGRYPLYDNMTVEDLIFLAGSYKPGASMLQAEIARQDSLGDIALHHLNLSVGEARNALLQQGDRVYIRQIPQWQLHRAVTLEGEVQYPGEYILSHESETLYELIQRAGGLADNAFPRGTILERKTIEQNLQRLHIPSLLQKTNPLKEDSLGRISHQEFFDYEPSAMNRIVLDMDELLASRGERSDVTLQPGDAVYIPPEPSGISVLGAVGANGTIRFTENEKVKRYVHRAGDFTEASDKNGLRLIKASGVVYSGRGTLGQRVDMGDVIVVPTRIKQKRDWAKVLTAVVTATTGVLTTALLIDRL